MCIRDRYITFIKVDFPAPFSPTIAWIVPFGISIFILSLARTPGKDFDISVTFKANDIRIFVSRTQKLGPRKNNLN